MKYIRAFFMALGMFSILPVPKGSWREEYLPLMLPSLTVVGLVIGLIWSFLRRLFIWFPLPLMPQSALIALLPLMLSGFLHTDGFMDTADAVCSRKDLASRRKILKDPHAGAFAVISLICLILFQFCAVCALIEKEYDPSLFIFIPIISRSAAGLALLDLKLISDTGFAAAFQAGTTKRHSAFIIFMLLSCLSAALYILGLKTAIPLFIEIIAAGGTVLYLYRQFQGMSGDLCGCIIQISEAAAILGALLC